MVAEIPSDNRLSIWAGDSDISSIVATADADDINELWEPCE
jgi:hypothetical protein